MRYVLGVDGGSSKTHALVLEETGAARGFGQAGCGNHQIFGLEHALVEIDRAVRAAVAMAGIHGDPVDDACYCLAGADFPEDYARLQEALQVIYPARAVRVKNDTLAAMRAGLSRPWGVVVICGTGFNAAGRAPDGREIVLPGLGPISGDWGGGAALSQEMIRLVMRAWDGRGEPTLLTQLVLRELAVPTVETLLLKLYHHEIEERRLLELTPLLFEAAEAGDGPACELVVRMGMEVGVTARALIRRLGLQQTDVEVILGGSVFKGKGHLLTDTVAQEVRREAPMAKIVRPRYEPVVGAALIALEAMGVDIDERIRSRLDETLPKELIVVTE